MAFTYKNFRTNILMILVVSLSVKLIILDFYNIKFLIKSDIDIIINHISYIYTPIDVFIWLYIANFIRKNLSGRRVIFDFVESTLLVVTVLSNFYASIISYGLYLRVFERVEPIEKVMIVMLTFVNGNAVYTDVFDGHKVFFSIVSIFSYLMLVLIIGMLQSALYGSSDE